MLTRTSILLGLALQLLLTAPGQSQPIGHCKFETARFAFQGDSLTQASCLLRHVAKWGNVSQTPATLPPELRDVVGKPTGSLKSGLRAMIASAGLSEAEFGGSLDGPLSHANAGSASAPTARYFVIHDTSAPWLGNAQSFPPDNSPNLNALSQYGGPNAVAHVFVGRLGKTLTGHDFSVPWRATKIETQSIGTPSKGLFVHVELIQPRRRDPSGGPNNDAIAPDPGFTDAQYATLATLYAAASVRGGQWLIPAFHAALDEGISDAHDDPQNFDLAAFAREVGRVRAAIGAGAAGPPASQADVVTADSSAGVSAERACAALTAALPAFANNAALKAGATGQTWKALYDGCDTQDIFAGKDLPSHNGRRLRCSTDPNKVKFITRLPDNTIVMNAKMSVDADGSPVIGGSGWPNNVQTWLTFDSGSETTFVNAEEVPFVVVPIPVPGGTLSFQRDTGIRKGDLAVVQRGDRCSFGVVGDAGPWFRIGEASLRTHEELGNPQCATPGEHPCTRLKSGSGVGIGSNVTYVIFPGTRPAPLLSQTVNEVAGRLAKQKLIEVTDAFGH